MRTRVWDLRLLFVLLLIVFAVEAYASGDCRDGSCNTVGGDTVVDVEGSQFSGGDSRAFAFAHALGDVDINDCLASTQWGTIIVSRQKVVLNAWCAAEVYDAKGMFQMAAIMRCNIPEILDEFATEDECERANLYTPPPPPVVLDDTPEPEVFEELYRQEQIHDDQLAQLLERVEQIEQQPRPAPRPQTVIQQQEFIDDEKRERLRALLEDEDENE